MDVILIGMVLCNSLPLLMSVIEIGDYREAVYQVEHGTVFCSERTEEKTFLVAFVGGIDGDGHLFWDCTHPSFAHIRESPEFAEIFKWDTSRWPRCLLWHGWLPALGTCQGCTPWAGVAVDVARYRDECALGAHSFIIW